MWHFTNYLYTCQTEIKYYIPLVVEKYSRVKKKTKAKVNRLYSCLNPLFVKKYSKVKWGTKTSIFVLAQEALVGINTTKIDNQYFFYTSKIHSLFSRIVAETT